MDEECCKSAPESRSGRLVCYLKGEHMTDVRRLLRNSTLALMLLTVGIPVAFAATDTTTTETAAAPQQDEGFDLSWLGLLGLIGLAGLRGRNNDRR